MKDVVRHRTPRPHAPHCRAGHRLVGCVIAAVLCGTWSAHGQMQLPGAVNGGAGSGGGSSGGGGSPASGAAPYVPPKPVAIEAPSEAGIAGHVLSHDGAKGEMTFEQSGAGLLLSKLSLAGSRISKPSQACTVDVALTPPLALNPGGRPVGAIRYSVPVPACPFNIDILDGAALVTSAGPTCDFTAADCRVSPGGLWGPRAADITPKRAKDLERERVRWETTMRANFHALLKRAGKDRTAVKAIARDQAAFSSEREMTCRDYEQETVHGFCSTQITEARALALLAQFGPVAITKEHKPKPKPKPKVDDAPPMPGTDPQP